MALITELVDRAVGFGNHSHFHWICVFGYPKEMGVKSLSMFPQTQHWGTLMLHLYINHG